MERAEAARRQKQEIQENKIRRVQLQESCDHFNGNNHILIYFHIIYKKKIFKLIL